VPPGVAAVALGLAVLAAQTTFDAVQPPDGRADALRDQLEQVQKAHR
jgi:hypothetical protein